MRTIGFLVVAGAAIYAGYRIALFAWDKYTASKAVHIDLV